MKSTLLRRTAVAVLAFAFPIAALADISGTQTLNSGQNFNFDSGTVVASGGDVQFTGAALNFVGSAKGGSLAALGLSGASGYAAVTSTILQELASFSSTTPIAASGLSVGTIVGLATNGGNSAKLLVTAITATSLSFQYTTYETAAPTGPVITKVLNNYSYIPAGFVNSGISPSTIFTIFGTNLAAPSTGAAAGLQDSTHGIPTTWNGATVTISAGGKNFTPGLYYALPTQIAAVMPAATPVGSATVTVNYNGTSNAFADSGGSRPPSASTPTMGPEAVSSPLPIRPPALFTTTPTPRRRDSQSFSGAPDRAPIRRTATQPTPRHRIR